MEARLKVAVGGDLLLSILLARLDEINLTLIQGLSQDSGHIRLAMCFLTYCPELPLSPLLDKRQSFDVRVFRVCAVRANEWVRVYPCSLLGFIHVP
jgi:hypothetical protein